MFKTTMGALEDSASVVYLRPETAQGIFVNFLNVQQSTRQKVPFGIAQIGKAFRNEITPGNFTFRTREFEQMEMQFFVDPEADHMQWFEYWKAERMQWHLDLGLREDRLHFHAHGRASSRTTRARRSTSSSTSAARSASRRSRACTTAATSTSAGTRSTREEARVLRPAQQPALRAVRHRDERRRRPRHAGGADQRVPRGGGPGESEGRVVLGLHPAIAPIKAGIFPLVKKDGCPSTPSGWRRSCGSASRVLRRERGDRAALPAAGRVGTPFCLTVDGQTSSDGTVTLRDRDTLQQERVAADRVGEVIAARIAG
jgi:glycyl-tRNA synthetase